MENRLLERNNRSIQVESFSNPAKSAVNITVVSTFKYRREFSERI